MGEPIMNLLCFFGSGISKASGLPMAPELTSALLSERYFKHSAGPFLPFEEYEAPPNGTAFSAGKDTKTADRAQRFLRALHGVAATYLASRNAPEPTYEEIFDLVGQVEAEALATALNPAVSPFVARFREQTRDLWSSWERGHDSDTFSLLAEQGRLLVQSVVRRLLSFTGRTKGMKLVVKLCRHKGLDRVDIGTLNHDLLLESFLRSQGVEPADGFSDRQGSVRYYRDDAYATDCRVRLVKPHGSINWYRIRAGTKGRPVDRYGIPDPGFDLSHAKGRSLLDYEPLFLTGTTSKALAYTAGIFGAQLLWLRRFLQDTNHILCCGYGWRDKGINNILFDWLYSSPKNRLILLHPCPERELVEPPHATWKFKFAGLLKEGRLRVVKKWLQQATLKDVLPHLE